ncbi:glycoside hydrolase family 68 protein [Niallia sp. 01092]|uniref:glycoside hydrolase family 68 protein n=1 Tax=unclassified Niallia TaxID=2837522 RepID=UPI003FD02119
MKKQLLKAIKYTVIGGMLASILFAFNLPQVAEAKTTTVNEEPKVSYWTRQQAQNFKLSSKNTSPEIDKYFPLAVNNLWIWDTWPLTTEEGKIAKVNGYKVIFALTAPRSIGWNDRHFEAAIRYFYSKDGVSWKMGGLAYKNEDALGQMQWAGSSIITKDNKVHLYYTATGRSGAKNDPRPENYYNLEQRIVETSFDIKEDKKKKSLKLSNWSKHKVILQPDGKYYQTKEQSLALNAPIVYSFRDPSFFKDPKTGKKYIIFEGNTGGDNPVVQKQNIGNWEYRKNNPVPEGAEKYNGNIGIAELKGKSYTDLKLLPPLLDATGVNQQLERPHIVVKNSKYYLFTISHAFTYAPRLQGPDGLYGFVSSSLQKNYKPLNKNGLVIANPKDNDVQTYSWLVMDNLTVLSFINEVKDHENNDNTILGGTFAPTLNISLDKDTSKITGVLPYGAIR